MLHGKKYIFRKWARNSHNHRTKPTSGPHQEEKKINQDRQYTKKGEGNVQGVPQSQAAALPRHQEEEETDKPNKRKQAQIEQPYEKH